MSPQPTSTNTRARAVALTPEALEILKAALERSWKETNLSTRLTRQVRAELMGVSVPTADRILSGQGVDRSSLTHAFALLNVPWNDEFCALQTQPAPELAPTPPSRKSPAGILKAGALSGILIAACSVGFITWNKRTHLDWINQHDFELHLATLNYHEGKYDLADQHLASAMRLAKDHESARFVAIAYKIQGEISCARGRLAAGEESYLALLEHRRLHKEPVWGPIHEVLGTVQIRLKKFEAAEKNLNIAFDAFTKSGETHGIIEVYRDRGILAAGRKKPYEALEWFAKSTQLNAGKDNDIAYDIRGERAMVLLQLGKYDEPQRELEACLAHWTKKSQPRWIALTEMRLALAEAKQNKVREAHAHLCRAKAGFVKVGDEARIAEANSYLKSLNQS